MSKLHYQKESQSSSMFQKGIRYGIRVLLNMLLKVVLQQNQIPMTNGKLIAPITPRAQLVSISLLRNSFPEKRKEKM